MYKVFIVDDEPFIIEGLFDIVDWAAMGMEIVGSAENGQDALDLIKVTPVDILITDISMPIMDGLTLIRKAREIFHTDLKVIVLSGFNEFDYLKEAMRLGIENYLLKPINLEELKSTLTNTLGKLSVSKARSTFNEQNKQILKDNVMYRWMTHQIDVESFNERATFLGIQLDTPYVAIAILRQEHETIEVFEFVSRQQAYNQSMVSFRDMDGDIVIVFKIKEPSSGLREAEAVIHSYKHMLSNYESLRFSLGSVEYVHEAFTSYENARKAQEYFMILQDQTMIVYSELPSGVGQKQQVYPLNWSEYTKMIMVRDKDSLLSRIDEDFANLQKQDGITPSDIKDIGLETIIRFKMLLKEIRHDEEPEFYNGVLSRMRDVDKIGEWIRAIQEAAEITVDSLIQDVKSPVVQQVLNHIHGSYNEDLSLKMLGSLYHIHPVYLGQLFQKEMNESFTEYMNKYRVEQAKIQLQNTPLKVHEISRNVGYWETGYFYKQFKKYVGISPTEYKGLLKR